jgi:hypothetical protein
LRFGLRVRGAVEVELVLPALRRRGFDDRKVAVFADPRWSKASATGNVSEAMVSTGAWDAATRVCCPLAGQ